MWLENARAEDEVENADEAEQADKERQELRGGSDGIAAVAADDLGDVVPHESHFDHYDSEGDPGEVAPAAEEEDISESGGTVSVDLDRERQYTPQMEELGYLLGICQTRCINSLSSCQHLFAFPGGNNSMHECYYQHRAEVDTAKHCRQDVPDSDSVVSLGIQFCEEECLEWITLVFLASIIIRDECQAMFYAVTPEPAAIETDCGSQSKPTVRTEATKAS